MVWVLGVGRPEPPQRVALVAAPNAAVGGGQGRVAARAAGRERECHRDRPNLALWPAWREALGVLTREMHGVTSWSSGAGW